MVSFYLARAEAGAAYPEHGEVVVALLHGVIDGVDKARIVFAALGDIVSARAGRRRHIAAHDLRDELRGLLAAIFELLVGVRVRLEDEVDVGLQRRQLGPVVAIAVVGEGAHHLRQLLRKHVASLVALRHLRLRRGCGVAEREVVCRRWASVSGHDRLAGE